MDSEKGNMVFARGHTVPPPLVFGAQKCLVGIGLRPTGGGGGGGGEKEGVNHPYLDFAETGKLSTKKVLAEKKAVFLATPEKLRW